MSMEQKFEEGLWKPMVRCDICNEEITNLGANVIWEDEGSPVKFVHKECDEMQHKDRQSTKWTPLLHFLIRIGYNIGAVDEHVEKAQEEMRELAEAL